MKKFMVGAILLIVAVAAGVGAYSHFRLRLVSTSPTQNAQHPYYLPVAFTYNTELKTDQKPIVKVEPRVSGTVLIDGKTVTFKPEAPFEVGQAYTVTVSNLVSSDGFFRLGGSAVKFTAKFVQDKDLPDSVRQLQQPDAEPPAQFQDETPD